MAFVIVFKLKANLVMTILLLLMTLKLLQIRTKREMHDQKAKIMEANMSKLTMKMQSYKLDAIEEVEDCKKKIR